MALKEKTWIWKLTWPFAHNNFTAWSGTIYHPKGVLPSFRTVAHETLHFEQQKKTGKWLFLFLYFFCLPVLWNKFRFKWEMEAYIDGSRESLEDTLKKLRSYKYGWLRNK